MKNQVILAAALALACAAVACSSGGTTSTSTGSGGSTSAATSSVTGGGGSGGGPMAPAASCIQAGDKGNENGVGTFCTPGGGECVNFPKAGLCLADVGQDQWFCTRIGCKVDADCGTAAHCHLDPAGAACVPDKCEAPSTSSTSSSSSSSSSGAGGAGGSM